jgi:hypothetical protein
MPIASEADTSFYSVAPLCAIVIYTDADSDVDQALSHGYGDGLSPVCRAELAEGGLGVRIDGSLGDAENLSDFPSRFPGCRPHEHLLLARSESRSLIWQSSNKPMHSVERVESNEM